MSPRPVLLVAIASLLLTSADANAQGAGPQERWYGYPSLLFDVSAAALIPAGIAVTIEEGATTFP